MKLFQISTMLLLLTLFLVIGAGCREQEQKSKKTGQAITDTVKDAEKNVNDAVLKMQEKVNQLEETDNRQWTEGVLQDFIQTHNWHRNWQGGES